MSFTLFRTGSTDVRLNLLTVPVLFLSVCMGLWQEMILSLLALSMHEYCHALAARSRGVDILRIDIVPCGFAAQFSGLSQTLSDTVFICSAGVIFSLICGVSVTGLCVLFGIKTDLAQKFACINIILGTVNFLPVMPLDGGRILYSALCSRMHERNAHILSVIIGIGISCTCIVLSLIGINKHMLNYTALVLSSLMLAGTISALKRKERGIGQKLMIATTALQGKRLPVSMHAFGRNAHIMDVKYAMESRKYNMITVLDSDMHIIGYLDESDILAAVCAGCETLDDALNTAACRGSLTIRSDEPL